MAHVHGESPAGWNIAQMRHHLLHDHKITVPMTWDLGRLHEKHLADHQAGSAPAEPEEALVSEQVHEHGDIHRYHNTANRADVVHHLAEDHGIPGVHPRENIYGIHAHAHPMKPEKAVSTAPDEHHPVLVEVRRLIAELAESERRRHGLFEEMGEIRADLDRLRVANDNQAQEIRRLRAGQQSAAGTAPALPVCECEEEGGRVHRPHVHLPRELGRG
jgi:hypothetical protein